MKCGGGENADIVWVFACNCVSLVKFEIHWCTVCCVLQEGGYKKDFEEESFKK